MDVHLYWTAQNIFAVAQQFITAKLLNKNENNIIEGEKEKKSSKTKNKKKIKK